MGWQLAAAANTVISLAYFAISYAILAPLVRERQLRANRLGTATAAIFFSCAVGHGLHAVHPLLVSLGDHSAVAVAGRVIPLHEALWDAVTAAVGVYYWTLRRTYRELMRGAALFADLEQQRITTEVESRAALAEARDLFASVLDAATEQSIIGIDLRGRVTVFNVGAERMLGHRAEEMLGRVPTGLFDASQIAERAEELGVEPGIGPLVSALAEQSSDTRQWTCCARDGRKLQVMASVTSMHGAAGEVTGSIIVGTDVTEQRHAEQALADSETRFRLAFETAPIGMAMVDFQGERTRLVRVNPAMCAFTGRSEEELCVSDLDAISHPDDAASDRAMIAQLQSDDRHVVHLEKRFRRPDGAIVWGQLAMSVISPSDGRPSYGVCLVEDVTSRKDAEDALIHQTLHDPLTGLANRTLLNDRIEFALAASTRSRKRPGILYIDLDGFKHVNDSAGHGAGDELLIQVAGRLRRTVRPGDTVARVGGDEFAIVCVDVDNVAHLRAVATRVLDALSAPFALKIGTQHISGSIGLAMSDPTSDPERLLADADAAMYEAKAAGKNRIATPHVDDQARAVRASKLLPELHDALRSDQLIMHGQPVVDLQTGAVVAVETLIRWRHPVRGLLAPGDFLAVAERSPLMVALGQRALAESCRMAGAWSESCGAGAPVLHVNVSGRQLESGHLTADVLDALDAYSLPASRIVIELTETHMPAITDSLRADLGRLRDRGVRIAIDDLGTGYSSLTRITQLPVDVLKIDLRFIAGLGLDPACDAVVRAVLSLGAAMGLSVIAEGIETPQQAEILRKYGCDTGQGYLYSPPRPEAELLRYLLAPDTAPVG